MRPFIVIGLLCLSTVLSAQRLVSRPAADSFLLAFHDTLTTYHPATQYPAGRRAVADSLSTARRAVAAAGDSLPMFAVVRQAARLQAGLGDGHISLRPRYSSTQRRARKGHISGLPIYRAKSGQLLFTSPAPIGGDTVPAGAELVNLNDRPAAELLENFACLTGSNDNRYRRAPRQIITSRLPEYHDLYYGLTDTLSLTYTDGDGTLTTVSLPYQPDTAPAPAPKLSRKKKRRQRVEFRNSHFSLKRDTSGAFWIMNIRSFKRGRGGIMHFDQTIREAFRHINRSGLYDLVVDIRGNGGGSMTRAARLASYLSERPVPRMTAAESRSPTLKASNGFVLARRYLYGHRLRDSTYYNKRLIKPLPPPPARRRLDTAGNVVVIINETTFSAATLFAALARHYGEATLIGATSGGDPSVTYGGTFRSYPLDLGPQRFTLRLPTWYFRNEAFPPGNLRPDLEANYTADDFRAGRDVRLDAAREYFRGLRLYDDRPIESEGIRPKETPD